MALSWEQTVVIRMQNPSSGAPDPLTENYSLEETLSSLPDVRLPEGGEVEWGGLLFLSQSCRTARFVQALYKLFYGLHSFISYAPFFSEFTGFYSFHSLRRSDALQFVSASSDVPSTTKSFLQSETCLKARYTFSVKLSDFTLWRHTRRKNWLNCSVLTGNSAGLRTVISSRLSHKQNCAVHSGNPTVSSVYLPTPRWHHLKEHPFLANHSADEHRMLYPFSNTTSYSTFYTSFSSFRITLWPMWLANSKQQPYFYPHSHTHKKTKQNWQKNWQTWWETCTVPENIPFSFSCSLFTQLNCPV